MPKPEIVERALAAIKGYAQYEYFFSVSTPRPGWSRWRKGDVRHTQPVEKVEPYIRFPFWPESRYLARCPSSRKRKRGHSKSPSAYPPPITADLRRCRRGRPVVATGVGGKAGAEAGRRDSPADQTPSKTGWCVHCHLAQGGQGAAAARLTAAALALSPDPSAPGEEELLRFRNHSRSWRISTTRGSWTKRCQSWSRPWASTPCSSLSDCWMTLFACRENSRTKETTRRTISTSPIRRLS